MGGKSKQKVGKLKDKLWKYINKKRNLQEDILEKKTESSEKSGYLQESETTILTPTIQDGQPEDEGTTVLTAALPNESYLLRMRTGEQILIRGSFFCLGSNPNVSDYTIVDNPAISRHHADILFREGQYWIKDNNSTNKTFIEGRELAPYTEEQLYHGALLYLADEGFQFLSCKEIILPSL